MVEYKEVTDEWASLSKSQRIPAAENKVTLNNLWPGTSYHIRVYAENSIGRSEASQMLHAVSEIEAPSEPVAEVNAEAVGSKAIRVMWKPAHSFHRNAHLISGYYVGFKEVHSSGVFTYKTVDSAGTTEQANPGLRSQYETVITNLQRLTKYVIVVKAFNRKGSGPASEEVYVKTNDMGMAVFFHRMRRIFSPDTDSVINHPLSASFMSNACYCILLLFTLFENGILSCIC